jgi:hypothetical protein
VLVFEVEVLSVPIYTAIHVSPTLENLSSFCKPTLEWHETPQRLTSAEVTAKRPRWDTKNPFEPPKQTLRTLDRHKV